MGKPTVAPTTLDSPTGRYRLHAGGLAVLLREMPALPLQVAAVPTLTAQLIDPAVAVDLGDQSRATQRTAILLREQLVLQRPSRRALVPSRGSRGFATPVPPPTHQGPSLSRASVSCQTEHEPCPSETYTHRTALASPTHALLILGVACDSMRALIGWPMNKPQCLADIGACAIHPPSTSARPPASLSGLYPARAAGASSRTSAMAVRILLVRSRSSRIVSIRASACFSWNVSEPVLSIT